MICRQNLTVATVFRKGFLQNSFLWTVKNILIAGILCLFHCVAPAQDVPYIRHFTPREYHLQNQNWGVAQSEREGWMYFANNGGLLEFDGGYWSHYPMAFDQPLRSVATDRNGRVFGGGFAMFGYWEKNAAGKLTWQNLGDQSMSELFGKEEIWHILPCDDFVLFQSFSTIYKYSGGKVFVLKAPGAIMFAQQVMGIVRVPVIGQGIYDLLPDNTFRLMPGTEILKDKIVQFVTEGPNGAIWIGTAKDGLFEWKNNVCTPWENPLNERFRKNQLNRAIALKTGGWAIGTLLDGVYVLDAVGNLRFTVNRSSGLQNNTVLSLLEDRDNNLWVGLDKGIDLLELNAPVRYFSDQSGQIGTLYAAAMLNAQLYIGSNQGLFSRAGNGSFNLVEGTQGQVWDLRVFDGQLLCGHNSGTYRIENGRAEKISEITGGWCMIPLPSRPDCLIQSTYTGLVVYTKNSAGKWTFLHRVTGFEGSLKKIIADQSGNIWGVHPNKGLFRLRLSDDLTRITEYRAYTLEDHLPTEHQLNLEVFQGNIILNTHKGIFSISTQQDSIIFTPWPGEIPGTKLIPGAEGDYFLTTDNTVTCFHNNRKNSLSLSLVPEYERIIVLPDGKYLFCIENGFAVLDTRQGSSTSHAAIIPKPVIRWVETSAGEGISSDKSIKINYANNTVHLHFAIPAYGRQPSFSWKLDGFTNSWSAWQTSSVQSFINLPSGNYTFRVKTDQNDEEASISFTILPPWYLSTPALVVYAVLVIVLFAGMELFNRRRILRHQQRILEENAKEMERQRLAAEHEKLAFEVDNKTRELSNAAFNLIRKNEALQNLKDILQAQPDDPNIRRKVNRMIDEHLEGDHDWEVFEEAFNRVHDNFFIRLMRDFPDMTQGDLRLAAYLRMNLSSKEIAPLLNMSLRGVENKRYRLRKKLGLPETENLAEFLINF